MKSTALYNKLDGQIVSREKLTEILLTATDEGNTFVEKKLLDLLMKHDADSFEITLEAVAPISKSGLNAPRHSGLAKKALDECGRLRKGYKYKYGKLVKIEDKKKKAPKKKTKAKKSKSNTNSKSIFNVGDNVLFQLKPLKIISKKYDRGVWLYQTDDNQEYTQSMLTKAKKTAAKKLVKKPKKKSKTTPKKAENDIKNVFSTGKISPASDLTNEIYIFQAKVIKNPTDENINKLKKLLSNLEKMLPLPYDIWTKQAKEIIESSKKILKLNQKPTSKKPTVKKTAKKQIDQKPKEKYVNPEFISDPKDRKKYDFIFEVSPTGKYTVKTKHDLQTNRSIKFSYKSDRDPIVKVYSVTEKGLKELQNLYPNNTYGEKQSLTSKDLLDVKKKEVEKPKAPKPEKSSEQPKKKKADNTKNNLTTAKFNSKYKTDINQIVSSLNSGKADFNQLDDSIDKNEFIKDLLLLHAKENLKLRVNKIDLDEALKINASEIESKKSTVRKRKNILDALKPIASKDTSSIVLSGMTGILAEKDKYVVTDAHALIVANVKPPKADQGKIINVNPKKSGTDDKYIDGNYPNYQAVIPMYDNKGKFHNLQELYNTVNQMVKIAKPINADKPTVLISKKSHALNVHLLQRTLKSLLMIGAKEVQFSYSETNKAIRLDTKKDKHTALIMPFKYSNELVDVVFKYHILDKSGLNGSPKGLKGINCLCNNKPTPTKPQKTKGLKSPISASEVSTTATPKPQNSKISSANSLTENNNTEFWPIGGETGKFLQRVEKKPFHSVVITIDGKQGAGKTTMLYQYVNDFSKAGKTLFATLEQHPQSVLTKEKIQKYISDPSRVDMIGDFDSQNEFYSTIAPYDFIFIDSWQKLLEMIGKINLDQDLRKRFNGKVFVVVFQQTTTGRTKGGAQIVFDGDIIIKMETGATFAENYAYFDKNRYTQIQLNEITYNIAQAKTIIDNESQAQPQRQTPQPENINNVGIQLVELD